MFVMNFNEWIRKKYDIWSGGKKSVNQFAAYLGISQPTVNAWIVGSRGKPETAKIVNKLVDKYGGEVFEALDLEPPETPYITIPIWGRIAAGKAVPIPKQDFQPFGQDDSIQVFLPLLTRKYDPATLFALQVEGESMIEEGIFDGDIIVLCKTPIAENGQLVAVRIDDEDSVTLKKYFRNNGTVRLQPANKNMKAIEISANQVHIEGKIVISIRRWK